MNNTEIDRIFQSVGSRYGYSDVTAEYSPFREFRIKWQRNYKWANFEVSDYLDTAPESVMVPLADTIFMKIKGESDVAYPKEVSDWLTSEEFLRSKQPVYLERFTGLSRSTRGRCRDIRDSYERLIDDGLLERDDDIRFGWVRPGNSRATGHSSILMKVVSMSELLDSDSVNEIVMDYCLYAQLAHISMGFNPTNKRRGIQYDEMLSRYPLRSEAEGKLRRLSMHI
ncbi:hypothetical protein [Candidatus Methanoprimaticola sp. MG2]|uniref:hypothetical protein n=1 Tax=Candidatus Methanoprimaticola sp. MG2 TaxID=3228838 RepID=UPI0039C72012